MLKITHINLDALMYELRYSTVGYLIATKLMVKVIAQAGFHLFPETSCHDQLLSIPSYCIYRCCYNKPTSTIPQGTQEELFHYED